VNIQRTFSEHSVNIQRTFSEHSGRVWRGFGEGPGNIQGKIRGGFGEHSVNIQGTPFSPLGEGLREDPFQPPDHGAHLGIFREHSGNIQGGFRGVRGGFVEGSGRVRGGFEENNCPLGGGTGRGSPSAARPRRSPGHIQGALREHSGNIQRGCREHSGRVERTPVSLHPNGKKHLKKVPRLTQNTTCKHEYPGRGLTRPNDVSQEYNSVFSRTVPPS
jgi:hypothetical protein